MVKQRLTDRTLKMYFDEEVAKKFAELEQNDKNYAVANIVDRLAIHELGNIGAKRIHVAELGGGAHPDRYSSLFSYLIKTKDLGSIIDWVDVSPVMLELARNYVNRKEFRERNKVIHFFENDAISYLKSLDNETLNLAIMKYVLDHINNLERLISLLSKKLKPGSSLVSTLTSVQPILKSVSTNARFLYKGKEFPEDETRTLKDGDNFGIKFFKESGNPKAGYLEGAETIKYYHSPERIKALARKFGFKIFLGDWKDYLPKEEQGKIEINQDILVMKKK